MQVKSLKVSSITHAHLKRIGTMNDTMESVIRGLIWEHIAPQVEKDIERINSLCGEKLIHKRTPSGVPQPERVMGWEEEVKAISSIFEEIGFDYGIYPEWPLKDAIEMASDEDQVGGAACFGDRDLSLAEVAVNTYCLYLDIPSPTTTGGWMMSPAQNISQ